MVWLYPLLIFFLGAGAFAQEPPSFDEEKIVKAMRPYMKTLNGPLTLFHWDAEDSPFVKQFNVAQASGAENLMRAQAGGFFDSNTAHGFYLATDPLVSQSYGGKDPSKFLLMQVTLPEGTKYLHIEYSFLFTEKMKGLLGEQCARIFANAISMKIENSACTELKRRVFQRLGVQALRYHWLSPMSAELCPGLDESAFVVTSMDWFKPEYLKAFTYKTRGGEADRRHIQEFSYHATKKYDPDQKPIWPDLPVNAPLSEDTRVWMTNSLLNCRKPAADELKDAGTKPSDDQPEVESNAPAN